MNIRFANLWENIPILPEAFLTFASKSSFGPSHTFNGLYDVCYNVNCVMVLSWFYQDEMSDATISLYYVNTQQCYGSVMVLFAGISTATTETDISAEDG